MILSENHCIEGYLASCKCASEMAELPLRDPGKLENWANRAVMKFIKETLHVGQKNPLSGQEPSL